MVVPFIFGISLDNHAWRGEKARHHLMHEKEVGFWLKETDSVLADGVSNAVIQDVTHQDSLTNITISQNARIDEGKTYAGEERVVLMSG